MAANIRATWNFMECEGTDGGDILRTLEEGWNYRPNWRDLVVETCLTNEGDNRAALDVLSREEDCYVRQFYLFRRTGNCLEKDAFRWAYRCHIHDASTGAAVLIKALTLAKVSTKEIAQRLHTKTKNIVVFLKLFFDVLPYLDEKDWLASVVLTQAQVPPTIAEFRQQHWLMAALLGGREGLERAVSRIAPVTKKAREKLVEEIRSTLTQRAHSYVSSLQFGLVQPGADDFDRMLRMLDVSARQPVPENRENLMDAFIKGIHCDLVKKSRAPESAGDPVLAEFREVTKDFDVTQAGAGKAL